MLRKKLSPSIGRWRMNKVWRQRGGEMKKGKKNEIEWDD